MALISAADFGTSNDGVDDVVVDGIIYAPTRLHCSATLTSANAVSCTIKVYAVDPFRFGQFGTNTGTNSFDTISTAVINPTPLTVCQDLNELDGGIVGERLLATDTFDATGTVSRDLTFNVADPVIISCILITSDSTAQKYATLLPARGAGNKLHVYPVSLVPGPIMFASGTSNEAAISNSRYIYDPASVSVPSFGSATAYQYNPAITSYSTATAPAIFRAPAYLASTPTARFTNRAYYWNGFCFRPSMYTSSLTDLNIPSAYDGSMIGGWYNNTSSTQSINFTFGTNVPTTSVNSTLLVKCGGVVTVTQTNSILGISNAPLYTNYSTKVNDILLTSLLGPYNGSSPAFRYNWFSSTSSTVASGSITCSVPATGCIYDIVALLDPKYTGSFTFGPDSAIPVTKNDFYFPSTFSRGTNSGWWLSTGNIYDGDHVTPGVFDSLTYGSFEGPIGNSIQVGVMGFAPGNTTGTVKLYISGLCEVFGDANIEQSIFYITTNGTTPSYSNHVFTGVFQPGAQQDFSFTIPANVNLGNIKIGVTTINTKTVIINILYPTDTQYSYTEREYATSSVNPLIYDCYIVDTYTVLS